MKRASDRSMWTAFLVLAFSVTSLSAQTLIVPNDVTPTTIGVTGGTAFPFDRTANAAANLNDLRVQTVYDSANFTTLPGPIEITALRWRAGDAPAGVSWAGGTFTAGEVLLGAAGVDHSTLGAGDEFAATYLRGERPQPAYAGPLVVAPGVANGIGVPSPWYVSVTLTTPFVYDPFAGQDLVIEVAHDGDWSGMPADGVLAETSPTLSRRMFALDDWTSTVSTGANRVGLVCEITYTPLSAPVAQFDVSATTAGPGEALDFIDRSVAADPSGIQSWEWDFDGDGVVDSTQQNPQWSFSGCGPVDVTLTVRDPTGVGVTTVVAVVEVAAPEARLEVTPPIGRIPLTVQFTDRSDNAPTSWEWDFDGDGVVDSTLQNPTWTYTAPGLFAVTMTASNACGSSRVVEASVDTRPQLCTQFGVGPGWFGGAGFYMDADVLEPTGIEVTDIGVQIETPGAQLLLDVWVRPDTYVGSERNRNAWTRVSSGSATGLGTPQQTLVDVSDFCLSPGRWGIALHYSMTFTARFNYSDNGPTVSSNAELALSKGAVYSPIFRSNAVFRNRNWNGCIYYEVGGLQGSLQQLSNGCPDLGGNVPSISLGASAPLAIGQTVQFELSNAPPNQPLASILVGFRDLGGIDLAPIGMPGCGLRPLVRVTLSSPTDAAGVGIANLALDPQPSLVGLPFILQGFVPSPGANAFGAIVGDAVTGTIGCW